MADYIASLPYLLLLGLLTASSYFLWRVCSRPRHPLSRRSVVIFVLGDIGRSPRMMYHAESFAKNDFDTYLVGYPGSKPIPSLLSTSRVQIVYLAEPPPYLRHLPFLVAGPAKVLRQVLTIVYTLAVCVPHPPEFILVQNPPSIPTLALVWVVSKMRGCKVIIDWHNLGYSILALRLSDNHPFVSIAKWFESYFGCSAYAHLFVTDAMRNHLVKEWSLRGHKVVLHDRPPARFRRASPLESHELFQRLFPTIATPASALSSFLPTSKPPYSTPFTHIPSFTDASDTNHPVDLGSFAENSPLPALRPDRTALVVSSTSWTPDEDFGMLLDALKEYEKRARNRESRADEERLPKILMVVTGKGPLRQEYIRAVEQLQTGHGGGKDGEDGPWRFVRCVSLWLEADDYPLLLGSADLGVSLHSSSSGLDLPMKVVDMFGCGLPVCALGFACLDELVKDGVNGLVFHDAQELAAHLESLLRGFPTAPGLSVLHQSFKSTTHDSSTVGSGTLEWGWGSWSDNWNRRVRPLLLHDVAVEAGL